MKIALVYDRVNKWGGAERVLLTLHEMFPQASLFTSVYSTKATWAKEFPNIKTHFLQKLSIARNHHEWFPFLMPLGFESYDFSNYDLVISLTSESAKGILTSSQTKHICYCLTPTRYLWSGYDEYFNNFSKTVSKPILKYLKSWDKVAASRPDKIIAISTEVKNRIKKYYNRDSVIVFPPVDIKTFKKTGKTKKDNYYLVVSRLVCYKKVDLVIKTFNKLKLPLVIIGTGQEENRLKNIANKNITFIKNISDTTLLDYYSRAQALIMPQFEDFGLVAVEAQAAGTPVIAYCAGGAIDTVIDNKTGVLFAEQSIESLASALDIFRETSFNENTLLNNAERFSKETFVKKFRNIVENV